MNRLIPLLVRMARGAVSLVLLAHPRSFRRGFGADVLDDLSHEIREAVPAGSRAAMRTAARGVWDAVKAIRVAKAPRSCQEEKMSIRSWARDAATDVRHSIRGFRREPVFSAAVIGTLALGIGANAAMFGIVDRLLVRGAEHVRDADRVHRLQITTQPPGRDVQRHGSFGYVAYEALLREGRSFDGVAAYSVGEDNAILGRGTEARRINRGEATATLFPLLGVTPALGRFYTPQEDDTVAPQPVAVIGYGLWQRDFGGRPDAIGEPMTLDNKTYTIVGVAPKGFTGADFTRVDVWLPESLLGRSVVSRWTANWNGSWLAIVARLKPDVTPEQAGAEATAIFRRVYTGSRPEEAKATLAVRPLHYGADGEESMEARVSTWLLAVSVIVLLASCANVVNLVLARGLRRRREMAVRLALGAGRSRLTRLLLAESMTLAIAGGGVGLGVAYLLGTLMRAWLIPNVEWPAGPVNGRVLAMSAVVSLASGLLVGMLPAWRAGAHGLSASLKTGAREGGGRQNRTRQALTMVQAALSVLLLVGAGLFVVSLARVRGMDLGLQPDRVLRFSVLRAGLATIPDETARQAERARRATFYATALERLRLRPDVEAASLAIGMPFTGGFGDDIRVPGRDTIPQLKGGGPFLSVVSAGYFETVGTRILRGRPFGAADRAGTAPVVIVNETMAATLWPSEDAIGKCFSIGGSPACAEIVGVAANTRQFRLREDESMSFYVPVGQERGISGTQLLVRPRGDAARAIEAVRKELFALDDSIIFVNAAVLQDRVDPQVRPWRLGATMFSLMGVLALVVTAGGLYSVMAYLVTHRKHEIGVRIALGARPADVMLAIARSGFAMAAIGGCVGFALAFMAAPRIEPLLFDTSPRDPGVYAAVAVTLFIMAALATLMPAARARRVNPADAMRGE